MNRKRIIGFVKTYANYNKVPYYVVKNCEELLIELSLPRVYSSEQIASALLILFLPEQASKITAFFHVDTIKTLRLVERLRTVGWEAIKRVEENL